MRHLLASVAAAGLAARAFLNTNAGGKLYMCITPAPTALDKAGFEALAWVEIASVGSVGETGVSENILTYDTWNDEFVQKAKGMKDAGSPDIELARNPTDAGQIGLRAAGATKFAYAFKMTRNDAPGTDVGDKPTTIYNRGLVTGPRRPNGRNEDFDLETFTLALLQKEIVVDPVNA